MDDILTNEMIPPSAERAGDVTEFGTRLAAFRRGREWTLQEVSKRTGVSTSALSKIERNELSPTISTVQRIADGFDLELSALLDTKKKSPQLVGRRSVTRAGEGQPYRSNMCDNMLLCSDLLHKRMTPMRTLVTARSVDELVTWTARDAEIFLTVIRGSVTIHSQVYEPLTLSEGDCLYYDAHLPHAWTSEGEEDAEVVWVIAK